MTFDLRNEACSPERDRDRSRVVEKLLIDSGERRLKHLGVELPGSWDWSEKAT
jgi:hypothetical protein